ncbi:MAG: Omp28 family outer membrane lipoprotein [Prevotella sp.]|nr:Omp28 family outer membrane lipoprotein [Bacteroides sp.]MCM1367143.1 Omp28 family outer membrane lipoprotein [Prevotella sp.]MCM1436539.1 Omp28 family outer membrane lipoprotein [Prevotella sp.]
MKSYIKALMLAPGLLLSLTACDHLDGDDRYYPYEPEPIVADKCLLIEEFTGMRCVNCPTGAETVHSIIEALDGNAVAVCIHPENHEFTKPIDGLDLTCPISTEIYEYYHPNFPAAIFDGGRPNTNTKRWSGVALNAYSEPTPLNVEVSTEYDKDTRKVRAHYIVTFISNYVGDLNLTMYLTEDGIIGTQEALNGVTLHDYEFNHVLRASFNGTWGQQIGTAFTEYQKVEGDYELTLKDGWKAENCNVVAFVGKQKGTVYNAVQVAVVNK